MYDKGLRNCKTPQLRYGWTKDDPSKNMRDGPTGFQVVVLSGNRIKRAKAWAERY